MRREWLEEHPDYVPLLEHIVEYEQNNLTPDDEWLADRGYDVEWEYADVNIHPSRLHQLNVAGFLDKPMDSNSTTTYCLSDRDTAQHLLNEVSFDEDGRKKVMHDFPSEDELPDDLFDDVIGYDEAKWLLRRGITTDEITNFLLVGPPGSAKTVFLLCISNLKDAEFIPSMDATSAGFMDLMFERQPKYMLFDELDDMDNQYQKSLSSYTETGIVKETKHDKTRELRTNTKTFASANSTRPILNHITNRFTVLEFEKYSREEYRNVCEHILPRKEGSSKKEARKIASLLWERNGEGDVREAISVARLSRGDPEKVVSVLEKHSQDGLRALSRQ